MRPVCSSSAYDWQRASAMRGASSGSGMGHGREGAPAARASERDGRAASRCGRGSTSGGARMSPGVARAIRARTIVSMRLDGVLLDEIGCSLDLRKAQVAGVLRRAGLVNTRHAAATKAAAVALSYSTTIPHAARVFGVPVGTLREWRRVARAQHKEATHVS